MKCPYCDSKNVDADFVDVGVGSQQVSPYRCFDCGATEIGPHDEHPEGWEPTEEEKRTGWYEPVGSDD